MCRVCLVERISVLGWGMGGMKRTLLWTLHPAWNNWFLSNFTDLWHLLLWATNTRTVAQCTSQLATPQTHTTDHLLLAVLKFSSSTASQKRFVRCQARTGCQVMIKLFIMTNWWCRCRRLRMFKYFSIATLQLSPSSWSLSPKRMCGGRNHHVPWSIRHTPFWRRHPQREVSMQQSRP